MQTMKLRIYRETLDFEVEWEKKPQNSFMNYRNINFE